MIFSNCQFKIQSAKRVIAPLFFMPENRWSRKFVLWYTVTRNGLLETDMGYYFNGITETGI